MPRLKSETIAEELPEILECSGEFGAELNSFVPFIHYLVQTDQFEGHRILTYRGMKPFYFFLRDDQILEKDEPRAWVSPLKRPEWLPNRDDHFSRKSSREIFPDYRAEYATDFGFAKPILAIHNKFSSAYLLPPLNYFKLEALDELFERYKRDFQIVFLPSNGGNFQDRGYSPDHQKDKLLDEGSVLRRHPEVIDFHDLLMARDMGYNELKLRLYATTRLFFTVQGGNAHMCSLFGGSIVGILHRVGQETRHSYAHGHFQYASNPPPFYFIAGSGPDFLEAARAIEDAGVTAGGVTLGPKGLALHYKFSEARFR